jgi:hypothetical protein
MRRLRPVRVAPFRGLQVGERREARPASGPLGWQAAVFELQRAKDAIGVAGEDRAGAAVEALAKYLIELAKVRREAVKKAARPQGHHQSAVLAMKTVEHLEDLATILVAAAASD